MNLVFNSVYYECLDMVGIMVFSIFIYFFLFYKEFCYIYQDVLNIIKLDEINQDLGKYRIGRNIWIVW